MARSLVRQGAAGPERDRPRQGRAARTGSTPTCSSFYVDEARPTGWNNTVFPGACMPQRAVGNAGHPAPRLTSPSMAPPPAPRASTRGAASPASPCPSQRAAWSRRSTTRLPATSAPSWPTWRAGGAQARVDRRVGGAVPGLLHLPGLPAEARVLARRALSPGGPVRSLEAAGDGLAFGRASDPPRASHGLRRTRAFRAGLGASDDRQQGARGAARGIPR